MNNLEKFKVFVDENYEKCILKKTYPININMLLNWVNSQCSDIAKEFALLFSKYLRHISFSEWHESLIRLSMDIRLRKNENKYSDIIIVIDDKMTKSNTWVSILLFHNISDICTDVINSELFRDKVFIDYILSRTKINKMLFLHVDDVSYTGTQIDLTIGNYLNNLSKLNVNVSNLDYLITCPYIGINAFNKLQHIPYVKFSSSSVIFNTFLSNVKKEPIGKYLVSENSLKKLIGSGTIYYNIFQYYELIYSIYFDHKLADGLSIFQKILALGSYYKCDSSVGTIGSLINGCEKTVYKEYDEILEPNKVIFDFDDEHTCPTAFYKKITYTLNGKVMNYENNIIDQL